MLAAALILGQIDTPTAMVFVAVLGIAAAVAPRIAPKTRTEAAVDRASAHLADTEALALTITTLRGELEEVREDLVRERAERAADRQAYEKQIAEMQRRHDREISMLRAEVGRLRRAVGSG